MNDIIIALIIILCLAPAILPFIPVFKKSQKFDSVDSEDPDNLDEPFIMSNGA